MSVKSATRGTVVELQVDETTGDGIVLAIPDSFKYHTFYIQGLPAANISAGKVMIESTDRYEPAGGDDFGPIASEVTVTPGVTAAMQVITVIGVFKFIRARISTNIVGGTININYVGS